MEEKITLYEDCRCQNSEKHLLEELITSNVKKSPVLDIGCGNGNILYSLKDNFDAEGIDPSKIAVGLAKMRNLNVSVNTIKSFQPKRKYGTIIMIGVLSMLPDFSGDLRRVSGLLREDGELLVTVPNATCLKHILGIIKEREVHTYTPSYFGFKKFIRKHGFRIKKSFGCGRLKRFPFFSSVILYILEKR
jgi:2-polyprenyl-3-methyl-5-hydroxy-6-metoxy-1,4-benzoquinol methylase